VGRRDVLTCSTGVWDAYPVPTYAYQWRRVDTSSRHLGRDELHLYARVRRHRPHADLRGHALQRARLANPIIRGNDCGGHVATPVAPVFTVAAALSSGSAFVGTPLTCDGGTVTGSPTPSKTYQWIWADTSAPISGATSASYTPVSGDSGHTLQCTVTATNLGGVVTSTTSATAAVTITPSAPTNTVAPSISGNPWPASTLTANTGNWSGYPYPTFTYQWQSGGTNIGGATSQTYKVASADLGAVITCSVAATNSQGTPPAVTTAGVTIVEVPLITATPAASVLDVSEGDSISYGLNPGGGAQLTSYSAGFAGTDATDITFYMSAASGSTLSDIQSRASTVIGKIAANPGKANYLLTDMQGINELIHSTPYASDVSQYLTDRGAYYDQMRAAGFEIVVLPILPTTNAAYNSTWVDAVNAGIKTFETQGRIAKAFSIADFPVMGPPAAASSTDLYGDGLHPVQRGQNYIERDVAPSISALLTAAVAPVIASVTISGTPTDGQALSASVSVASGHPRVYTYAYQWKRNGSNISAATSSTYTLQPADVGTTITCAATATNTGGTSPAVTSNSLGPVAEVPVPVNSVAPVISGTATQGETLSSTTGTWTNTPTSYAYQWKRDGSNISAATSPSYILTGSDVGANITCAVTASNNGGASSPATSNSLGPVIASNNGLLDSLSASAAAAYSTRKLKGTYAGSAIKVRRSSDNTTQDIGFDGSGNLDTAALATFVGANSGFIDTWYDQSGNGLDLSQATTANQPRIRNAGTTDTLNSQAAIRFGVSTAVNLYRATGFPATNNSIAAVLGTTSNGGFQGIVTGGGAAANGHMLLNNAGAITAYNNAVSGPIETSAQQFSTLSKQASYIATQSGTSNLTIYRSASPRIATLTANAYSNTEIMVGNWGALANPYTGVIPELIIFGSVISAADMKLIDASHSAYWGTDAGRYQDASLPAQTSDSAPSGYNVTYSSQYPDPVYTGWHAFDQTTSTTWAVSSGTTGYVARQIPSALTLTAYAVSNNRGDSGASTSNAPSAWTFEGSNDGSSWTVLDTQTSQTGWGASERRVYPIAAGSRGSFTYHRINITGSNGSFAGVGELEFITS
jgi:hypothetical protein